MAAMRCRFRLRHCLLPSLAIVQTLVAGCLPEIKPPVITGTFTLRGSSTSIAPSTVETYSSMTGSNRITREPPPKNKNMVSAADGTCEGEGGYADLKAGKAVIVYNQGDSIIGTGELSPGKVGSSRTFTEVMPAFRTGTFTSSEIRDVTREDTDCVFTFKVAATAPATFYRVEVANRGKQVYSAKDLAAMKNTVSLEIGN
jgi:hypothetical protein